MALAADTPRAYEQNLDPMFEDLGIRDNVLVYHGACLGDDGAGRVRPLIAGDSFRGFSENRYDNTTSLPAHAADLYKVKHRRQGVVQLTVVGVSAITDVGSAVYATDDGTFTLVRSGTFIGYVQRWIVSTTCLVLFRAAQLGVPAVPISNRLNDRFELKWVAGVKGKPAAAADIQSASEAVSSIADTAFEAQGTNTVTTDSTFSAEGGIQIASHGADGDRAILAPHTTTNMSPWKATNWGTEDSVEWECTLKTGSSIASCVIFAGLKLTNTDVVATDDDQVYFRYQNAVTAGDWACQSSIANVDTTTDSLVAVVASTKYRLKISIDASRIARFYINDVLIFTTAALTTAVELIPFIGVGASGAAAVKSIIVFGQAISRIPS